ncbi:hypothetical protein [Clostridium perfringens]|uniref:hypothetical protein n=1 Tax=Clostridium perfringens TaxID=1502 RepID=UPI0024BCD6FF|nr:hypothetical protein [Clostridium perfringens]
MNKKILALLSIFILMFVFIGCGGSSKESKSTEEKILSKGEKFTFTKDGKDQYWVSIDEAELKDNELRLKYSYGNMEFKEKKLLIRGDNFVVKENNNFILDSTGCYWQEPKPLEPGNNCTVDTSYSINNKNIRSLEITLKSEQLKQIATWNLDIK